MDLDDKAGVRAPEFPKGLTWLNSDPLSLENLKSKVVLVDFWTYSCINCQRTLPYLNQWHEKYKDSGLVIIGVHSPEFDFEKKEENVKEALEKYKVTWPVVLDSKMDIWGSYGNNYWPAKYLISHEGKIIFTHFGEGNYVETELKIQDALREAGFSVDGKVSVDSQGDTLQKGQHQLTGKGETRPQDGKHPTIKPKDLCLIPFRVAIAAQEDGWWVRSVIIWNKPNPMPESVHGSHYIKHYFTI